MEEEKKQLLMRIYNRLAEMCHRGFMDKTIELNEFKAIMHARIDVRELFLT